MRKHYNLTYNIVISISIIIYSKTESIVLLDAGNSSRDQVWANIKYNVAIYLEDLIRYFCIT